MAAYAQVLVAHGAPLTAGQQRALLRPVQECLDAGHAPETVLAGLGMWRAEGFGAPQQLAEFVGRVAALGPLDAHPRDAPALVAEGGARLLAHEARRRPSKAAVRNAHNDAVLSAWVRERKEQDAAAAGSQTW